MPPIPLFDIVGSAGAVELWHNGPICVKAGVTLLVMKIVIITVAAHWPAPGVNV